MKKIAVYGKGGSGKSTISAALSVLFSDMGLKVLLVGCDPKSDSTLHLTGGRRIATLLDLLARGRSRPDPAEFIVAGRHGVDCVEAGGPVPGAGCGGRGVARMFELFRDIRLLERSSYDVVMFDVLGDVVCGGFAAPLRLGFADRAFIVVSEEPLSLYAANNIVHAIAAYADNGVRLGGLILNVSDDLGAASRVEEFGARLGTQVIGTIPRDTAIQEAERRHLTAAELDAGSATRSSLEKLAVAVLASFDHEPPLPAALPQDTSPIFDSRFPIADFSQSGANQQGDPLPLPETTPARGGGMFPDGDPLPQPERTPARGGGTLGGAAAKGGKAACARAARLLGLDRGKVRELGLEVMSVTAERGLIAIALDAPAVRGLTLTLAPASASGSAYASAGDCTVTHSEPLSKMGKKVLDYAVAKLRAAGSPFAVMNQALANDSETVFEGSREKRTDTVRRTVELGARHWTAWGQSGTRGVFFFGQERARLVLSELRLGDGAINVHHGTEVCQASEQATTRYSSHFVRFPWGEVPEGALQEPGGLRHYITNIQEHEMISGSNQALAEALDDIVRSGRTEPVCVDVSCSPVITGEDWQGLVTRFRDRYSGPVIASAVSGIDLSAEISRAGMDAAIGAGGKSRSSGRNVRRGSACAVNLVGFPPARFVSELIALLEQAGIRVLQRQLPIVSLKDMRTFLHARAQVLWPQSEYAVLYRDLFEKLPLPALTPSPPFGLSGTRKFVEEVAVAVGVGAQEALRRVESILDAAGEELDALRHRASEHRLGIALTSGQSGLLEKPELLCGVPVVQLLEELGFKVEVLGVSEDEKRLRWWLRSGLSAVCSDLSYDQRLLDAGVGLFGLADLEAGAEGAVRTVRRLLSIVETPFFRNFRRFGAGA